MAAGDLRRFAAAPDHHGRTSDLLAGVRCQNPSRISNRHRVTYSIPFLVRGDAHIVDRRTCEGRERATGKSAGCRDGTLRFGLVSHLLGVVTSDITTVGKSVA